MWEVIGILTKIMIVVGINLTVVAYLILVERKIAAFSQDRVGPNRAGLEIPFLKPLLQPLIRLGLLHPLADGAKMILEGGCDPRLCQQAALHPGPLHRDRGGDHRVRGGPVRAGRPQRRRCSFRSRLGSTWAFSTSSPLAAWRFTR